MSFPPFLHFPPFLLNSGLLKLPDGHSFQKGGKTAEIEGLERGTGKTKVSLTPVLHIFELMRCAERENTKWEGEKKQDFLHPW